MNKVFEIGNLTRDPELSETSNGVAYCRFSIAVNRDYKDSDGNKITDFFNVVAWRGHAEICGKFLKKGSKVGIVGSLENRSYEDKDGNKRTVTEIIVKEIEFLTPKNSDGYGEPTPPPEPKRNESPQLEICEDELPF